MVDLHESFERSCRLCAEVQDVTIMIFSMEAVAMHLQKKLNQYLLVDVNENDKLPKNICIRCCTKLQTVCDFIDSSHKAQKVLSDRSLLLEKLTLPAKKVVAVNIEKVVHETPSYFNADSAKDVTNMEVSIDPMTILQHCNEDLIDESIPSADATYLRGIDSENVTIMLVKQGEAASTCVDSVPVVNATLEPVFDPYKKPFQCDICNRGFVCEFALKNHIWTHNNEDKNPIKEHKCPCCELYFEFKCDLILHMKDHRNLNECTICGRTFKTAENLKIHMTGHESPANSFVCKVCDRSYNSRSNLKTHSITHSNVRPYTCPICKKCFKRNQDLKFHINQHTGAKPYKCPFCDKSFASSGNCYSHRSRMHPGSLIDKPIIHTIEASENVPKVTPLPPKVPSKFQCELCEHSFVKRDNYLYHMYQHTGQKPYNCSVCPDRFITRRGLLIHHDNKHPDKDRPLALLSKNKLLK